jgi:hypothetical protein
LAPQNGVGRAFPKKFSGGDSLQAIDAPSSGRDRSALMTTRTPFRSDAGLYLIAARVSDHENSSFAPGNSRAETAISDAIESSPTELFPL